MSSVHRTQPTRGLFSPPVIYHNLQVTNSIGTKKILVKIVTDTSCHRRGIQRSCSASKTNTLK